MIGFFIALVSGALMSVLGVKWMGAAQCICGMSCGMVHRRKRRCHDDCKSRAEIYVAWRCDRSWDYMDGYQEYGAVRTCKGGSFDRDFAAYHRICH